MIGAGAGGDSRAHTGPPVIITGLPTLPHDAVGATIHGVTYTREQYEALAERPVMPETPNFDAIARRVVDETGVGRLEEWDSGDPERVVTAMVAELKNVWNARGAADIGKIESELSAQMGVTASGPYVKNLDRALRSLDR